MKTEVLKKIIVDGPITAKKIVESCGIEDDDPSHRLVRIIVNDLTLEGWPIVGGARGFWVAKSLRDRRLYKRRLRSYIKSTEQRILDFENAYQGFNDTNRKLYRKLKRQAKRSQRKIKRRKKS